MKKLLVLLAVATIVAAASVGTASAYSTTLYNKVIGTLNDPADANTGTFATMSQSEQNTLVALEPTAIDMTQLADGNDIAEMFFPCVPTLGTFCPDSVDPGPLTATKKTTLKKAASSQTGSVTTAAAGANECLVGVKIGTIPIGATYQFGGIRGKVDVECEAIFGVSLGVHSCITRYPGGKGLGFRASDCNSNWGFMAVTSTLKHKCDYTTFPYVYRVVTHVVATYPGGTVSGTFRSRKITKNCA